MAHAHASKATLPVASLFVIIAITVPAAAHGTGGGLHASPLHTTSATSAIRTPASAAPLSARAQSNAIQPPSTTTTVTTPAPSFAASCENDVRANCEARAQARYDASGGDQAQPWSAPVPTTVPATPPDPGISEPQTTSGPVDEQSGGSSRPAIEGGGPTLADCMALWEPAVHMSKALWRTACVRTLNGVEMPSVGLGLPEPKPARHQQHAHASLNTEN